MIKKRRCKKLSCSYCLPVNRDELVERVISSCAPCLHDKTLFHFYITYSYKKNADAKLAFSMFEKAWKKINQQPVFSRNAWLIIFEWKNCKEGDHFHIHGLLRAETHGLGDDFYGVLQKYGIGDVRGQGIKRINNYPGLCKIADYCFKSYGDNAPNWFQPQKGKGKKWYRQSTKPPFLMPKPESKSNWIWLESGSSAAFLQKKYSNMQ